MYNMYQNNQKELIIDNMHMSDESIYTGGLFFGLTYKYELRDNLFLGLEVQSYSKMHLEIESFMVGPKVEIRL